MFTGLVEEVGTLKLLKNQEIVIKAGKILSDLKIGDSVAVNGLCLTATKIKEKEHEVTFHFSPTTKNLSCFNNRDLKIGSKLNLERALKINDRLGGHIVQGHVDGKARIVSMDKRGEDYFIEYLYPAELKELIVEKGSVTVDGISVTVSSLQSRSFTVTIIPQTFKDTNLHDKKSGDFVHIEADLFARYIKHIIKTGGGNWQDTPFGGFNF